MRITMRAIAEKAGVSTSTVSLALSGHPRIPERTRRQIRELAEAMGYEGTQKQTQSGPTLGLLISNPGGLTLVHQALEGIMAEATAQLSPLQLYELNGPLTKSADEFVRVLRRSDVKGAVVLGGSFPDHIFQRLHHEGFPFVCIGKRELQGCEISWVSSDYINGAREAVQHLVNMGHTKVALATDRHFNKVMFRERVLGYKVALTEAGLDEGPHWVIDNLDDAIYVLRNHAASEGVHAVFTSNCPVASHILAGCSKLGIDVPGELAVVAFDDDPGTALVHPPLTTVKQPLREMGATATRTLLSWLRGAPRHVMQTRLQTQLIVRESCGAGQQIPTHAEQQAT